MMTEAQLQVFLSTIKLQPHGRRYRWVKQENGTSARIPLQATSEIEAKYELIRMASEAVNCLAPKEELNTVGDHLLAYLDQVHPLRQMSAGRKLQVERQCEVMQLMGIASRPVTRLTQIDIDGMASERDFSTATHRGYASVLKQVINLARAQCSDLPPIAWQGLIKLPSKGKPLEYEYRRHDLPKIFAGLDKRLLPDEATHESGRSSLGLLARLAYFTAQRFEVLVNVQWNHIGPGPDGTPCIFFDRAKQTPGGSKSGSTIPINDEIQALLDLARGRHDKLIWGYATNNHKIIRKSLNAVVSRLGYRQHENAARQESWHTFRHSRVVHLHRAGLPDATVAAMLGDSIDTVRYHYMHADRHDDMARNLKQLPKEDDLL